MADPTFDFSAPPAASPPNYEDMIRSAAKRHNFDPDLAVDIIKHGEWAGKPSSHWNARATSPKGAAGVMQLMPATAQRFGVRDAYDPAQNIDGGVRYMAFLNRRFNGDPELIAAGYNAGEGNVQAAGNRVPHIRETQNYVDRVRQAISSRFDFSAPGATGPAAASGSSGASGAWGAWGTTGASGQSSPTPTFDFSAPPASTSGGAKVGDNYALGQEAWNTGKL
jgi:hypothetical protein